MINKHNYFVAFFIVRNDERIFCVLGQCTVCYII